MRDYYAARALEYDAVYLKPERQGDLRRIAQRLPDELAGRTVLDVACGTAWWTRCYAPHCPSVTALDASAEMLALARSRLPAGPGHLVRADAHTLPFRAASFDAAFAGFWWSHLPRVRIVTFLRGLHRVLAPGARVVMVDNRHVAGSSSPVSAADPHGDTWQTRTLGDGRRFDVLKNFPTEAELRADIGPYASTFEHVTWEYYWAASWTTARA